MIRFLIYLLLIIIVSTQANEIVENIIKQHCKQDFFNVTNDGHNYCENIPKEDAARIIGILCLQK